MPLFVWILVGVAGWLFLGYLGRLLAKATFPYLDEDKNREWTDFDDGMAWFFTVLFGPFFLVATLLIGIFMFIARNFRPGISRISRAINNLDDKVLRRGK